ncbi:DUF6300 family protein [Nonomuraea sp. CA-141351]|uniref:DUF6300 family protein n=1 Tax=Nonomuraea sp. CA-141351 TaxID=3239996 RepID=UPI003D8C514F
MTAQEPSSCPRCRREGLLLVRVPYGWTNAEGTAVDGRNGVVLCAACDAQAPHAAPLFTWFHVNSGVERETSEEFVRLLVAWAESASVPPLDEGRLDEEISLWRSGSL